MELMQEVKVYSDDITSREEQEEEEEEEEEITNTREESSSKNHHHHHHHYNTPFSSPSLSLSSSPSTTTNPQAINVPHHQQQIPWFNMNIHDHHSPESHNSLSGLGLLHHQQIDFMELSLGNNNKDPSSTSTSVVVPPSTSSSSSLQPIEKEHMFDKVVTPSDVGKLNRLVIPKQHAEKYFPLDSTTNEKGLLLNFEDRNGKLWRFRYSYWNSSQSYVMTKGWSRFVKEKKLDAGDIVSFQRGVGELYRHRLYIDWRRRSNHMNHMNVSYDPSTTLFTPFFLPNQPPHYSMIRWGGSSSSTTTPSASAAPRLYSNTSSPQTPRHYNYQMYHPFNQQQNHVIVGSGSGNHHSLGEGYYMRSSAAAAAASMPIFSDVQRQQHQQEGRGFGGANVSLSPMIIDSVPVAHHHHHYQQQQQQYGGSNSNSAAKRLRLFGVNMECGSSTNDVTKANSIPSTSFSLQPHQHEDNLSASPSTTRFGDQRGEGSSMLFDLDPSLQYRQ